jgi:hypothetical protein
MIPALCAPALPRPRGPRSHFILDHLRRGRPLRAPLPAAIDDPLDGDDTQLALYACYELHYRSFAGVDDRWEWDPGLLGARRALETEFVDRLREELGPEPALRRPRDVVELLPRIIDEATGPSLSLHMERDGTLEQFREFAMHRSAYQLKEADPHTWAIPRVQGAAKAALVTIQDDEYGAGVDAAMHYQLFAGTLRALGLDDRYGAYLDRLPGSTLATVNLVSMFGLHRRWRGALIGHLAVFEMTSVTPMSRYSRALGRLGFGPDARRFYDVHVIADAEHEVIALRRMVAGLVEDEPGLAGDVVFGARAVMDVEARFADAMLAAWARGATALLDGGVSTGNGRGRASALSVAS